VKQPGVGRWIPTARRAGGSRSGPKRAGKARAEWLRQWNVQAAEAEKEWQSYLGHGAGHMDNH
jgi:hypothetical protein